MNAALRVQSSALCKELVMRGYLSLEAFRSGYVSGRMLVEGMTRNVCLKEASSLITPLPPGHCPEGRTRRSIRKQKLQALSS